MSLAAETREAVRERPFLMLALRAGVVNYRAAAGYLDVGETDAVAAALRRFGADLPPLDRTARDARVRMRRGVGPTDGEGMLSVGGTAYAAEGGDATAVLAGGAVDAAALAHVLGRLAAADCEVTAAGVGDGALVVVVADRGATALRVVEDALGDVPTVSTG